MDWKKITETMTPYLNKAKEYGQKAAKFAEEQIQTTPLFIKTQEEYESLITEKRVVIIAYDETQDVAKEIRLLSTIWMTRAFMDTAKLRFIILDESLDFIRNNGFVGPLDMRVRFEWEETFHFADISEIKNWWQSPIYRLGDTQKGPKKEMPIDPLLGK